MGFDYETIYDWTAKRAGGAITVYGKTREGNLRRIVNVDRIVVVHGMPQAVTREDVPYWLSLQSRP